MRQLDAKPAPHGKLLVSGPASMMLFRSQTTFALVAFVSNTTSAGRSTMGFETMSQERLWKAFSRG